MMRTGDDVLVLKGEGVQTLGPCQIGVIPLPAAGNRRQPSYQPVVRIGAGTVIHPYAVIYAGAVIGENCFIGPHTTIREGAVIGDRCVIGNAVEVNYETVIGDDCRIMSMTHLTGRMVIGAGSFFGVGVVTSNDRRIDLADYQYRANEVAGPRVGRSVMVGSGANLLAGITIGDGAIIAAGALVVKNVPAGAVAKGPVAEIVV